MKTELNSETNNQPVQESLNINQKIEQMYTNQKLLPQLSLKLNGRRQRVY